MAIDWRRIANRAVRAAVRTGAVQLQRRARRTTAPVRPGNRRYPGDFTGQAQLQYTPRPDGRPDPGEVVWTWVPFEEDHTRGKDRPVLVVGHDDAWLLALMLTSKDHDGPGSDFADEAVHGREWIDLGTGAWDRRGRPSQVRTDRVVRVDPTAVRREGAQLDADRFEQVAKALRSQHGWV